jgi:hypothetical protein
MEDVEDYSVVKASSYSFNIKRSIRSYNGSILMHTYTLGGDYDKCVTISYKYKNNIPVEATIPHLLYEPECSIGSTLERGGGSEIMIKTFLRHAHGEVPTINYFKFDDMSKIDCLPKNMSKSPVRKLEKPVNLAFFSIAYHGHTWYELRFNAEMINKEQYKKYRDSLSFLTEPEKKVTFERFLEIAQPPLEQISVLEPLYNSTETYRDFFNSIPKRNRCDLLYHWLTTFMKSYIGDIYTETNWVINVNTMDSNLSRGGGYTRRRRRGGPKQKYLLYEYKDFHSL